MPSATGRNKLRIRTRLRAAALGAAFSLLLGLPAALPGLDGGGVAVAQGTGDSGPGNGLPILYGSGVAVAQGNGAEGAGGPPGQGGGGPPGLDGGGPPGLEGGGPPGLDGGGPPGPDGGGPPGPGGSGPPGPDGGGPPGLGGGGPPGLDDDGRPGTGGNSGGAPQAAGDRPGGPGLDLPGVAAPEVGMPDVEVPGAGPPGVGGGPGGPIEMPGPAPGAGRAPGFGGPDEPPRARPGEFARGLGRVARPLDDAETQGLLERGWRGPWSVGERFADHDQRVETMVAIARELGVDPSVGVMQANFGTPQELGYADLARLVEAFGAGNLSDPRVTAAAEAGRAKAAAALSAATAELTEALASSGDEADPKVAAARAAVAAASAELAAFDRARAAIAAGTADPVLRQSLTQLLAERVMAAKPGDGPMNGWEIISLDYNGDGVVDQRDLDDLHAAAAAGPAGR